jgi:hypothetical protein
MILFHLYSNKNGLKLIESTFRDCSADLDTKFNGYPKFDSKMNQLCSNENAIHLIQANISSWRLMTNPDPLHLIIFLDSDDRFFTDLSYNPNVKRKIINKSCNIY